MSDVFQNLQIFVLAGGIGYHQILHIINLFMDTLFFLLVFSTCFFYFFSTFLFLQKTQHIRIVVHKNIVGMTKQILLLIRMEEHREILNIRYMMVLPFEDFVMKHGT